MGGIVQIRQSNKDIILKTPQKNAFPKKNNIERPKVFCFFFIARVPVKKVTQAVIFPIFIVFHLNFPFCVLEMNIWSFPPEPVTDGPLKLRDTALCLWHCGIYRRKRSNSSAETEHEMVNSVSWRFTCLEAFFVSNVVAAQCLEAPELYSVCISGNDCLL